MCKIRRHKFCCLVFVGALSFALWKLVRRWHSGAAEKTGHVIDTSIGAAAKKVEKAAATLESWAESGLAENLGKGVDDVLAEARAALDRAAELVQSSLLSGGK
jgi:hypothetical protein